MDDHVLLPETPAIRSRLIYLKDEPIIYFLSELDEAIAQTADFVNAACDALTRGGLFQAHPRRAVGSSSRASRISRILPQKAAAFMAAAGDLVRFWELP